LELIFSLSFKFTFTFNLSCVFNQPELSIYNKLVKLSQYYNSIIFVSLHFTLPVSYKKPLIADFFVLFKINNKIHFSIIEYDGPSHYNSNYYRFNIDSIKRDIIKNNFCKNNNISILRVFDTDTNYFNKITVFIESIISNNGNAIFDIPNDTFYNNLLKIG